MRGDRPQFLIDTHCGAASWDQWEANYADKTPDQAGSVSSVSGHPEVKPEMLPDNLPPVEPFHELLLPAVLRPWVMDISERMQCPPDFPAAGVVVALASLKRLLKYVENGGLPTPFTLRDVYRHGWTGLGTKEAALGVVELLLEYHWLISRPVPSTNAGGCPTEEYFLNKVQHE